jgi:hypothetical protein
VQQMPGRDAYLDGLLGAARFDSFADTCNLVGTRVLTKVDSVLCVTALAQRCAKIHNGGRGTEEAEHEFRDRPSSKVFRIFQPQS